MQRVYCHVVPPIWATRHPDMAAGWLTRFVRHNGWDVVLLDLNAELYRRESRAEVRWCWDQLYASMDPTQFCEALFASHEGFIRARLQQALDRGCRVFGLMLTTSNARVTAKLSRLIKEMAPAAHVVVGGAGATSLYRYRRRYGEHPPLPHPIDRDLGDHAIDSWVLGEGEITLVEVLERLERGHELRGIPGLVLSADGPHAHFRERALIKDLAMLPPVDFEGFDLGLYGFNALPFQLSRGCAVARCAHCGLKGYSRGFRVRPPLHAIAEIEQNVERYGIREFHFVDLGSNGDLELLEGFCDELIARALDIRWQSFLYVRPDMTLDLLRKMVRSGCVNLNYGFETGSDAVLRTMRKRYTAADAARLLRVTREAGGRTTVNLMVGHPGEGEAEFEENLVFLARNAENIDMVAAVSVTELTIHSPLLDERDALGVELVGSGGRWQSTDGTIDWRVRNERVHRLTEHLRTLGIPCHEAYWEPPELGVGKAPAPELGAGVSITAVEVTAPALNDADQCPIDEPVLVHAGYLAHPRVCWAVFDLEATDIHGQPVFGTPTASASLRAVELHREGFVRMAFGPRDLPPGELLFTVTARSALPGGGVFDRQVHRRTVSLLGVPACKVPLMAPYTWTHHDGRLEPATLPIEQVRVLQGGENPLTLTTGAEWRVEVHLRGRDEAAVEGRIQLRLLSAGGECFHETPSVPVTVTGERTVWHQAVDPTGFPRGPCTLLVDLHGEQAARFRNRLVVGEPHRGLARLWPRIRRGIPVPSPPEGPDPRVLHAGQALPEGGVVPPGAPLTLVLRAADVAPDAVVRCRVTVEDRQGRQLALEHLPAAPGGDRLDVDLTFNLLDGAYRLGATLIDAETGQPLDGGLEQGLRVESPVRSLGGGRVFAPHRMSVTRP